MTGNTDWNASKTLEINNYGVKITPDHNVQYCPKGETLRLEEDGLSVNIV